MYLADLQSDDCVFLPAHWPRQYDFDLKNSIDEVKFVLTYNYGKASPWINVALAS